VLCFSAGNSDIYGGDYEAFNLKASTVASAFGKLVGGDVSSSAFSKEDVAASLLHMIGANIAQVAYLTGRAAGVERILFAGNFLRHNRISSGFLADSINYWSRGEMKALFLKHEGPCSLPLRLQTLKAPPGR
jgi:type II pantothenate kinase